LYSAIRKSKVHLKLRELKNVLGTFNTSFEMIKMFGEIVKI